MTEHTEQLTHHLDVRAPSAPNGPVVFRVQVEVSKLSHLREAGSLLPENVWRASIKAHYKLLDYRCAEVTAGSFAGSYDGVAALVSLSSTRISNGGIFIDPSAMRGHRVGSYLMNIVVGWAKQWPDASLYPLTLNSQDAYEENRDRRNWFYEQFKIPFEFQRGAREAAVSLPCTMNDLVTTNSWEKNITVRN